MIGKHKKWYRIQRISSINDRWKIRQGEGKNSIGNGEVKELICMTYGHELRGHIFLVRKG